MIRRRDRARASARRGNPRGMTALYNAVGAGTVGAPFSQSLIVPHHLRLAPQFVPPRRPYSQGQQPPIRDCRAGLAAQRSATVYSHAFEVFRLRR